MSVRPFVRWAAAVVGVAAVSAAGLTAGASATEVQPAAVTRDCESARVPVTVPGVPGASLYGELCVPDGADPTAVQLLVHGGNYTHEYWDWPLDQDTYSYVNQAVEAGYATFNVDRLGAGESTRPLSALMTLDAGAEALHDVITQLRAGQIGERSFDTVIWVGHSFGSAYAWKEATMYTDVDAFVITGLLHEISAVKFAPKLANFGPAMLDPKYLGTILDPGYLTSMPGTRDDMFYYPPNADPDVIALDEKTKDMTSALEFADGVPQVVLPLPPVVYSRQIEVPTVVVIGQYDNMWCGPPAGVECTTVALQAHEEPYYSPEADLVVKVVPDSGHNLALHYNASVAADEIHDWLAGAFGSP